MGARNKLNVFFGIGAFFVAVFFGAALQSWGVFFITLLACVLAVLCGRNSAEAFVGMRGPDWVPSGPSPLF